LFFEALAIGSLPQFLPLSRLVGYFCRAGLVRQQIGYIFQAHNLLTFLTAKQNVRMSLELHDRYLDQNMDEIATDILNKKGRRQRAFMQKGKHKSR
jgi:ABC-type lipoprotein export system ATPase subunit